MKKNGLNTLNDLLMQSTKKYSDSVALAFENSSITFKQLTYYSELLAGLLQSKGVYPGDHIAILSENCPEWGIAFFGIIKTGATVVNLDVFQSEDELKFALTDSESVFVFASESYTSKLKAISYSISSLKEVLDLELIYQTYKYTYNPVKVNENTTAILIYTSGTMGTQKGVMLSHSNIIANILSAFECISYEPGTSFLSLIPLSHMFGINAGFLAPLYYGAKITYSSSLKGDEILRTMQQSKVEILVLVPLMLKKFYSNINNKITQTPLWRRTLVKVVYSLSKNLGKIGLHVGKIMFKKIHDQLGGNLKFFICGGSPLEVHIEKFFNTIGIPVLNGYGLTETSPIVSVNTLKDRKYGSVGKTIPNVEIKFTKEGEVLVKGPSVMKGYFKNYGATTKVLKSNWFYTGDIGEMDSDGFLYIIDRIKNVIVLTSGLKLFPNEIESVLLKSKYIKEVCIIKRKIKNEEQPFAVIFPDYNLLKDMSKDMITSKIREELEHYQKKHPAYKKVLSFELWEKELPKTSTKKIRRKLLEDFVGSQPTGKKTIEDREFLTDDREIKVVNIISKFLNKPEMEVGHKTYLNADLGIDSIMKIELLCQIEKDMEASIPEEMIFRIETFEDLMSTINSYSNKQTVRKESFSLKDTHIDVTADLKIFHSNRLTRTVSSGIIYSFLKLFFRLKVNHADRIPKSGTYIIVANHTSMLDFPLLCTILPKDIRRNISVPAAYDYFYKKSFTSWLFRMGFNIIPMKRYGNYYDGLRTCSGILNSGNPLIVFPEGTRSVRGNLQPFKPGIGLLSYEMDVSIVPVYIKGAYKALPKGSWIPKPGIIEIRIGNSIHPEDFKKQSSKEPKYIIYQNITNKIKTNIEELIQED